MLRSICLQTFYRVAVNKNEWNLQNHTFHEDFFSKAANFRHVTVLKKHFITDVLLKFTKFSKILQQKFYLQNTTGLLSLKVTFNSFYTDEAFLFLRNKFIQEWNGSKNIQ